MRIPRRRIKLNYICLIVWLIIVLFLYLIFSFSSQNGTDSENLSLGFTSFIVSLTSGEEFIDHIQNTTKARLLRELDNYIRKAAHFFMFFSLGMLFYAGFRQLTNKTGRVYLVALGSGVIVGVLDELHQSFVDGRGPLLSDIKIDAFSVAVALFLVFLLQQIGRLLARRYLRQMQEERKKC